MKDDIIFQAGVPVVLVPGWGFQPSILKPLAETIQRSYQVSVTVCTLPGYADAPDWKVNTGSVYRDWDALSNYLMAQVPAHPAIWMGWSLGGMIALYLATRHADRVKKVITIASNVKFIRDKSWAGGIERHTLQQLRQDLQQNYQATLERFIQLQCLGLPQAKTMVRDLKAYVSTQPQPQMSALQQQLDWLMHMDLRVCIDDLCVPILQLFGERDTLVPIQAADLIEQHYGHRIAVKRLEGAGHAPFLSDPQAFLTLLDSHVLS